MGIDKEGHFTLNKSLDTMDINNKPPQIRFICGNRGPGKTFGTKTYLLKRFINHDEKFILTVRFDYEMDGQADTFMKDLNEAGKFNDYLMTEKRQAKGVYKELFLASAANPNEKKSCGYVIALNKANAIKRYSPNFVDADRGFFDEFQTENGDYLPNEVGKLESIMTSISRGGGKTYRYVPWILVSNTVSIVNPYFTRYGITKKLLPNTKFLRGDGYTVEIVHGKEAAKAIQESPLGSLMRNSDYLAYSTDGCYLNDNYGFVEKMHGERYSNATIICDGKQYGVWVMKETGIIYINHSIDTRCQFVLTFSVKDHNPGSLLTKTGDVISNFIRKAFQSGQIYFDDLETKSMLIDMIGMKQNNK